MASKQLTARARARFLEILRATGSVSAAAREAKISRGRLYGLRRADPTLAAEWDAALEEILAERAEALETEAYRRAVDGVERPYFFQGQECGRVREYSDSLMKFLLQTRLPERYAPGGATGGDEAAGTGRGAAASPEEPRMVIELHLGPESEEPPSGGPGPTAGDGVTDAAADVAEKDGRTDGPDPDDAPPAAARRGATGRGATGGRSSSGSSSKAAAKSASKSTTKPAKKGAPESVLRSASKTAAKRGASTGGEHV